MKGLEVLLNLIRIDKDSESSTELAAHTQILNNKITYLSILTLNVNGLNSPIKRHCLANWIKKEDPTICCLQETHLIDRNKH
jgi:hypothetical protein